MPKEWLEQTRQTWEQTANLALEQAGREERIDGRSLAERRDAGQGRYPEKRGRASATVAQAERVAQRTATAQARTGRRPSTGGAAKGDL